MFGYFYEQLTAALGGEDERRRGGENDDNNGTSVLDSAVFVIPNSFALTDAQTAELNQAGQRQGVPFEIGRAGPQRHALRTKHIKITESIMAIQRDSLKLCMDEIGHVNVSFTYDATTHGMCSLYFRGNDATRGGSNLRINDEAAYRGPYTINRGRNVPWSLQTAIRGTKQHKQSIE